MGERAPRPRLQNVVHSSMGRIISPTEDYKSSALGDFVSALPSVDDLQLNTDKLFQSIRSGDHAVVERLLADMGHKVEIVPKIGCSPLHHSKFNLANRETETGDNPLIVAARVDSRMVEIVLNYGGNPNHANNDRDTPLSIAACRSDKEAIEALMLAGANLRAAVVKLTSLLRYKAEKNPDSYNDLSQNVKHLTVLLSDDVYLKCRCPIKAAFDVGRDIANIRNVRDEFKIEFELLIDDANLFACRFMNNIDRMWEAREILSFPVDLMRMAIDQRKKKFVSHPFCQQIIFDRWYGELANKMFYGKTAVAIKYIFSPFFVIPLLLKFFFFDACRGIPVMESNLASLFRMKFTPFLCFITDAFNYVIFLAILVCVCLTEQETDAITMWEYALYVCVISRILIELDLVIQQGWMRYFLNVWNYVDILILSLLCVAALYKGCIIAGVPSTSEHHKDTINSTMTNITEIDKKLGVVTESDLYKNNIDNWSKLMLNYRHFLNVSYIYAATEFVLFLRLLTLLEVTRSMGPMMIALKYLLKDVLKFSVLLGSTILGTSITIHSMSVRLEKWSDDVNDLCKDTVSNSIKNEGWQKDKVVNLVKNLIDVERINHINITCNTNEIFKIEPPKSFGNHLDTIRSIMWSTFGLFDVENVEEPFEASTMSFINIMLVLYILLSCVLLLNMLIGILSSTFDRIQENCDIEWKYARSELLKEYSRCQPFLIPFSTFLFPIVYWFRRKLRKEQKMESKKSKKCLSPAAEQVKRDKIISDVCERFRADFTEDSDDECAFRPRTSRSGGRQRSRPGTRTGSRQDDFDVRVRQLRRQKSELVQFKRRG